ncbi:MAG: hypothetical protein KO206_02655 [Methanomicrobiaceae archaeon]|uniref:Glycerophosphoryl diester phosphodiesterase membrane domain-containing protein n=1 Tax=hydrocarbon metagenome TaxID=938273 RepID=A0A0W8FH93_9ZZZZ|nr:hypothetical protein [Methanomicrobiaceae archaeon]MDD5419631.1 hypothetical protein [Methanomicrobiaceae archaeon]
MTREFYALAELDSALQSTRDLLWPFRLGVWLRLAVIAFFVGGGGGAPQISWTPDADLPGEMISPVTFPGLPDLPGLAVVLAIVAAVMIAVLVYLLIGAIFQFVFVDCVSTRDVVLSRFFRLRAGKGARLFLFQIGITILFIAVLAAALLPFFLAPGRVIGVSNLLALLFLIPVVLIVAILFALVMLFTIDFVVPIMIRDDCGVIEGWRRLLAAFSLQWMQVLVYVIVRFLAGLAAGILMIILTLLALAIIAVPFVLIGLLYWWLQVTVFMLLPLIIPYLIIAVPAVLLIMVPFITFFRSYSLKVLGRLAPDYAMLP